MTTKQPGLMMSPDEVLREAARLGLGLRVEGGTLYVQAGKLGLPPEFLAALQANRAGLVAWLTNAQPTAEPVPDDLIRLRADWHESSEEER